MKSIILTKVNTFTPSFKDFLGLKPQTTSFLYDFIKAMYKDCKIIDKETYLEVITKKGLYFTFIQFGDKIIRKQSLTNNRKYHYKIS